MIDSELREMFSERERSIPDPARVAMRISGQVQQRRQRIRTTWVVAAAVVAVVGTVFVLVPGKGREAPPTTPTTGPSSIDRLMPAPSTQVRSPVRPTWLPPDLANSLIVTNAVLEPQWQSQPQSWSIAYERQPHPKQGIESVTIHAYGTNPIVDPSSGEDQPSWVTRWDTRVVDINGHSASQFRMSSRSVVARACDLTWQQGPQLWITVHISERTTDPTLTCDVGLRVARSIVEQPQDLARTVRLTLVPAGYQLAATGTSREDWCPTDGHGSDCLTAESGRNYGPSPGTQVSVHGHPGTISRSDGGFLLNVPDWIRIFSTGADVTDAEILRMAETAIVDGGS